MGLPSFSEIVDSMRRDAAEFVKDPANKAWDLVTGYDLDESARVRDEQAAGNASRETLYRERAPLYDRFDGEFDAPSLGSPEAFEAMSHEDIKAAVDSMNGGSLRASAEGWKKIGESLTQALNDFRDFITHETAGKWEGIAKDSAVAATGRYATESGKLAEAGTLIGTKIAEAATAVDQVKATLPPVAERGIFDRAVDQLLPTVGFLKLVLHERDEAHQQAIEIMRTVYTPVMQQSDTRVPKLPEPPRVADPELDWSRSGVGAPGIGAPNPYAPFAGPNSGSPNMPTSTPGAPIPGGAPGSGAAPGADAFDPMAAGAQPGANGQYAVNPNQTDALTAPASAWTAPAAASGIDGTRLGQSGVGPSGSGIGGYSAGAGGLGSGGSGGSGAGAFGGYGGGGILSSGNGSGAGSGAAGGAGTTAGTPGSGAASARSGMAGAGMMPGAGARGRGEDESEHKTPGYLVNVDNGSELIGNLPLAAPPVIGGN
ncbi:PPE domain-containing protein [Prescottella defluvii]|uniref:PPE domain-containing protein n=1 Tax=Prescottella defluvii TaxID=1323361 RepID=UPI0004F2DDD1|nr:PPE domain-containing protein [Prescottella defluvii]